ncbi:Outer membrane receptor proteins, mostly Fe transport [Microbulbifer thermotolerans]|nr:Outer membrane receptor proteins, mostly Fe transport [Microbulbifer thermotolerans]
MATLFLNEESCPVNGEFTEERLLYLGHAVIPTYKTKEDICMNRVKFRQGGVSRGSYKFAFKRSVLAVALGLCVANGVQAQSTTGSIHGSAPEGATVIITNNSGFSRTVTVDASGNYNIRSLPIGTYTVTAKQGEETIGTRTVPIRVGAGADVSFGDPDVIETVMVTGERLPAIDTGATDTRVVITSEQLNRMPIGRSAEDIALLAPGANGGAAGYFDGLVSFGGAGISENAYYINGFISSDPLSNLGGFDLPFGAIDQQETYTGGYGAKYGRSSGGVINQVGKRGDNEFHYGAQVVFRPKELRSSGPKTYFQDMELPEGYEYENESLVGTLYERKSEDFSWSSTYSGYVSGPLIENTLFGFVAYETELEKMQNSPKATQNQFLEEGETDTSKLYAKLDWNVSEDHLLEFTYMQEKEDYDGSYSAWEFEKGKKGESLDISPNVDGHESEFTILNYTGFLTETLTLNAMYGHGSFTYYDTPVGTLDYPYISSYRNQDPSIVGDNFVQGLAGGYNGRDAEDTTDGIRLNLEWVLGDHTLTFGIDNMEFEAENEGTMQFTDVWVYAHATDPSKPISSVLGVGAPGGDGYYVYQYFYETATTMKLEQDAYYIEDSWQVTDDILLNLGLRNDKFTNYNNVGEAYMESDDQWAPRLGVAWDVFGDSSLKLFANAGRYYLAMPNNVAIRGASASTYTREYFTYTGVDPETGAPTGLTALGPGPVSSNGEYGEPVDPLAFAPADLESMYQDEYIMGFEKTFLEDWTYGAKFTFRDLKSGIDDVCDPYSMLDKLSEMGVDPDTVDWQYCYMFNPGDTNTFSLANLDASGNPTGTRTEVTMSADDWGMPKLKREYKAIDLFVERPFDGKWELRVDYTYSKLQGNTEGQVKSEFGQDNISKTQDWDVAELMMFSDGYLANDRRHQLKVRGSYALTDEVLLSANASIKSGMPISCLGYYNPDGSIDESSPAGDPVSYGSSYHTCFGSVAEPGKERTPWTRNLDLAVTYTPAMFEDKLSLSLQVFNVLDEQEPLQVDVTSEEGPYTVSNTYRVPIAYQTPRYAMLTATLNF